jgi:hypothetical protein
MGLTLSRSFDVIDCRQSTDDFWIDMKYKNYFALSRSIYRIHLAAGDRFHLNLLQRLNETHPDPSFVLLPAWRITSGSATGKR